MPAEISWSPVAGGNRHGHAGAHFPTCACACDDDLLEPSVIRRRVGADVAAAVSKPKAGAAIINGSAAVNKQGTHNTVRFAS